MTIAMNDFYYDHSTILGGGSLQAVAAPSTIKSDSRLARTFERIRKVLTPVAKKTPDKSELKTRDERRAAEIVLETEGRKGKSIKRKLLEGCSPLARLKRRRHHENATDTSSDALFQCVHEDRPEDATMVCDTALSAPDVEMVLEDPVSALVSLMAGLSLSDADTLMDTSLDTDADLGLTVDLHLDTDVDMDSELDTGVDSSAALSASVKSISWATVSGNDKYTPYKQTGRFKRRGNQLPTLADCWRLMDERDAKTTIDVDQLPLPLRRTARLPASLARLDRPELSATCFDLNASTDTLVDGSFYHHDSSSDATLVEPEHDSTSGCLLKALRSLSLSKMIASGAKTPMSSRTRRHA